jgi:hypothetical protein
MSQVPANREDGRRRYTHQAFDVTYLGKPIETGPSGYGRRLSATYQASILMAVGAGAGLGTIEIGDLTSGIWSLQIVNHVALTSGTLQLQMPAFNGAPLQNLVTALDLTAAGAVDLDNPILAPLAFDRPLTAAVAGGTAGETAVLSLLVTPAENGWF